MNITEVRITKKGSRQLKGFATIIIDDCLVVKNIKIIEGKEGLFISMPSHKLKNGEYRDIVHPLNTETRKMMQDMILKKFEETEGSE